MEQDYEQELLDLIDSNGDKETIIDWLQQNEIFRDNGEQHRWETWYWALAKVKHRYFGFTYSRGNTEYQDGSDDGQYEELFFDRIQPVSKVEAVFKSKDKTEIVAFESDTVIDALQLLGESYYENKS